MARCMGSTKDGKRCARKSMPGQTFCKSHIKSKSGKSRKLSVPKCGKMLDTRRSPFSGRKLKKNGRTYGQIYTVCRQRMNILIKKLEAHEDLPERLAKYAKDLRKEWVRTRRVVRAK